MEKLMVSDSGHLLMARPSTDASSVDDRSEPDPHSYRTPLVYPHRYFERYDRPSLARAAGIVLAEAVVLSVAIWVFVQQVMGRIDIPASEQAQVESVLTGQVVLIFFMVFLGWLILAAIFHVFVWFADGNGGFGTTLAVVGEAELAALVLMPISLFVLFGAVGQVPSDPQAAAEFLSQRAGFNTPLLALVGFVSQVWVSVITGFGLADAHDVDLGKMLALAIVLGVLFFLIT